MFLDFITVFIENYGLATFIISLIVAVVTLITDKLIKGKIRGICVLLPFLLGIVFCILSELIVKGKFSIGKENVYAGFLCGSFSSVISAFIKSVIKKRKVCDPVVLMVSEILSDALGKEINYSLAEKITTYLKEQEKHLEEEIEKIILEELDLGTTEINLKVTSALIISSYKTLSLS